MSLAGIERRHRSAVADQAGKWNDEPAKSADAPDEEVKTCQWPMEERCSLTRQRPSTTLSLSHLKMAEQEPADEMHWVLDQVRAELNS